MAAAGREAGVRGVNSVGLMGLLPWHGRVAVVRQLVDAVLGSPDGLSNAANTAAPFFFSALNDDSRGRHGPLPVRGLIAAHARAAGSSAAVVGSAEGVVGAVGVGGSNAPLGLRAFRLTRPQQRERLGELDEPRKMA